MNKVYKHNKSLYGIKQLSRAWFDRFNKTMKKYGYFQYQAYRTLFVKYSAEWKLVILIVYVDDIILIGDYEDELIKIKTLLVKELETKDLGSLKCFLGMEVAWSRKGILVSRRKYVLDS